jgi:hypothetical protein
MIIQGTGTSTKTDRVQNMYNTIQYCSKKKGEQNALKPNILTFKTLAKVNATPYRRNRRRLVIQ